MVNSVKQNELKVSASILFPKDGNSSANIDNCHGIGDVIMGNDVHNIDNLNKIENKFQNQNVVNIQQIEPFISQKGKNNSQNELLQNMIFNHKNNNNNDHNDYAQLDPQHKPPLPSSITRPMDIVENDNDDPILSNQNPNFVSKIIAEDNNNNNNNNNNTTTNPKNNLSQEENNFLLKKIMLQKQNSSSLPASTPRSDHPPQQFGVLPNSLSTSGLELASNKRKYQHGYNENTNTKLTSNSQKKLQKIPPKIPP